MTVVANGHLGDVISMTSVRHDQEEPYSRASLQRPFRSPSRSRQWTKLLPGHPEHTRFLPMRPNLRDPAADARHPPVPQLSLAIGVTTS